MRIRGTVFEHLKAASDEEAGIDQDALKGLFSQDKNLPPKASGGGGGGGPGSGGGSGGAGGASLFPSDSAGVAKRLCPHAILRGTNPGIHLLVPVSEKGRDSENIQN